MDTLFFIASKLVGFFIRVDMWIMLAIAAAALCLLWERYGEARMITFVLLASYIVIGTLPLGALLLRPLEAAYAPNPELTDVDGIIVLGGAERPRIAEHWNLVQVNEAGDRHIHALALAKRFPDAPLILSGGSGRLVDLTRTTQSEADMVAGLYLAWGEKRERLMIEGQSRNTAENARFSFAMIEPAAASHYVLVTSAFHMPRAMRSFQAAGWPRVTAFPVDHRGGDWRDEIGWDPSGKFDLLNIAIKEYIGRVGYALFGR